jgi:LysM repeat protein
MAYHFQSLPKLVNLRGKTKHNGWYKVYDVSVKTDIAIHHSLTKTGNSEAFANYHVGTLGWPEVAYHFVILKDGTIEWNHDLGVLSYHVGNSNKFSVGICLVGDFRTEKPTDAQKESLALLVDALKKDLPNYKQTRGHNEFPGYSWKACPVFDYRAVINRAVEVAPVPATKLPNKYVIQQGDTFWSIAKELSGITADAIVKANPNVDPAKLKVGQAITLPAASVPKTAVKSVTKTVSAPKKKEYVYFPPGHGTWSVYPTNKPAVKKNAIGAINPTKFGGLTYEVLAHPQTDVVTIKTSSFSRVNVYVGDSNSKLIWK